MINATYLKVQRTASHLRVKKGDAGRLIGRTKGGMSTKFHALTDTSGRPISFIMTAGQVRHYIGVAALLDSFARPNGCSLIVAMMRTGCAPVQSRFFFS